MKIEMKEFGEEEFKCLGCNYRASRAYKLNEWGKEDFLCADCFLNVLIGEEYEINEQVVTL